MRRSSLILLLFSTTLLFTSACDPDSPFDKGKFADLGRTAAAINTAVTSSDPCGAPEALEHELASGIAAVRDRANSDLHRNVVNAYTRLLATYQDGLLLCRSRHNLSRFDLFPKGRIYVSQDLDALVEKYGLSIEKHQSKRTGAVMRTIDGNSIQVIWESAQAQIKNIEVMVKYN